MVRVKPFILGVALVGVWFLCSSDIAPGRYGDWAPFFMERSELERSVFYADGPREMDNPGKIWVAGNRIYVVERYNGIHIIDNTYPSNPVMNGFIVAPGCIDIAVREGIVYFDNAVDLVAFDLATGAVTTRLKNYFPEPASPTGERYNNDSDLILVGWKQVEKTEGGRP